MASQSNCAKTCRWTDFPIDDHIIKSLQEEGLQKPLPIQIQTFKAALLDDKHVLGAAPTGSGKTLAYAIPLVNRILTQSTNSSALKAMLNKKQRKEEDFELIDGEMMSIEDMILDKELYGESEAADSDSDSESEAEAETESQSSDKGSSNEDIAERTCPDAIVLVPTRELAVQVKSEFDKICRQVDIKCCTVIGGICQDKQFRIIKKFKPQIIIATPGRLHDIIESDTLDYLNAQSIASIMSIVIDEADRMVQKGHFEELLKILDMIKNSKQFRPDKFNLRVYLFSATLTFLHDLPERLKFTALKKSTKGNKKSTSSTNIDPKSHNKKNKIKGMLHLLGIERSDTRLIDLNDELSFGRPSSDQLVEMKFNCMQKDKDLYLYYFLTTNAGKRTLMFCNSKDCLRRLTNVLSFLGYKTQKLHSEMDQKKRLSNLEKFMREPGSVLVATDIAARGLDIKNVRCVVHYQVPRTCESYIHRSGRTARVFESGTSLTLCEPKEIPLYRRLCNNINSGKNFQDLEIDINLRELLKSRIALAQQCDKIDHKLREKKSNKNWFAKAAKECDIELDQEDFRQMSGKGKTKQQSNEEDANDRRRLEQAHKQLKQLLKQPLISKKELLKSSMNKVIEASEQVK